MDRRCFLGSSIPSFVIVAGCLSTGSNNGNCAEDWSPQIEGEEPSISAAESKVIDIEAKDVQGLYISVPLTNDIQFDLLQASLVPSPDQSSDSYPPKWYWNSCTDVSVSLPIEASKKAGPGDYTYKIVAMNSSDSDSKSEEEEFSVTIN